MARMVPHGAGTSSTPASHANCASPPRRMAGHARVQGHDPQAVNQEHLVQRQPGGGLAQQMLPHRPALVVVSHNPDDLAPEPRSERLDHGSQLAIGSRLTRIYEVAGEHQRRGNDAGRLDAIKELPQSGISVDRAVQPLLTGDQVSIGKMEQDTIRPRVFRNPQCRHRTVTSSARCAVRRQSESMRQPSYPPPRPQPVADAVWRDRWTPPARPSASDGQIGLDQ